MTTEPGYPRPLVPILKKRTSAILWSVLVLALLPLVFGRVYVLGAYNELKHASEIAAARKHMDLLVDAKSNAGTLKAAHGSMMADPTNRGVARTLLVPASSGSLWPVFVKSGEGSVGRRVSVQFAMAPNDFSRNVTIEMVTEGDSFLLDRVEFSSMWWTEWGPNKKVLY